MARFFILLSVLALMSCADHQSHTTNEAERVPMCLALVGCDE